MRPRYYHVRPGQYLHWPEYIARPVRDGGPEPLVPRRERIWAQPGDVLRVDNEFIERCFQGQEFKCIKLGSPGKLRVLDPEKYPVTVRRRLEALRREAKGLDTPTKEAAKVATKVKEQPPVQDLPGIDTGEAAAPTPEPTETNDG